MAVERISKWQVLFIKHISTGTGGVPTAPLFNDHHLAEVMLARLLSLLFFLIDTIVQPLKCNRNSPFSRGKREIGDHVPASDKDYLG